MKEWENKKVKDLCKIGRGRVISQEEISEKPGIYPVYSSQSINEGEMGRIESFDFDGEYVTWTTDGAYAGTIFHRKGKFNCTNVCGTLKAKKSDEVDLLYLSYLLATESKKYVSYVGNPKLMNGVMGEINLKLPTSKSEQTRIAQILSTADKAIEQTEALIAKYQRIKTGLMQDLLTRGIDEQGNIRSKATHKFVVKNGIEVPEEWEVETINQHCESSAFGPRFSGSLYSREGNIATLRTTDIDNEGDINYTSIPFAKLDFKTFEKHLLKENDLLITRSGTVGLVSIYKKQLFQVIPGAFLIRFRLRNSLNPEFLRYYFKNENGRQQLFDIAEGGVQKNIRGSSILKLNVPVPKEDEQIQIINKLHKNEEYISIYLNALYKLQSLKTGLMQDLLSGKVRVKTNPL